MRIIKRGFDSLDIRLVTIEIEEEDFLFHFG